VLKSPVFNGPGKFLGSQFDVLAQSITGFRMKKLFWAYSAGRLHELMKFLHQPGLMLLVAVVKEYPPKDVSEGDLARFGIPGWFQE